MGKTSSNLHFNKISERDKYSSFHNRNMNRLCVKYPFLSKAQVKAKVKQLWVSLHGKKKTDLTGMRSYIVYYFDIYTSRCNICICS